MDRRTKRQKLEAMANQSVSPHEAEIAKEKLKELKEEEPVIIRQSFTVFWNGRPIEVKDLKINWDFNFTNMTTSGFGEY